MTDRPRQYRTDNDFDDAVIESVSQQLQKLTQLLHQPPEIHLQIPQFTSVLPPMERQQYSDATWIQQGQMIVGEYGQGSQNNQLDRPFGLCIDDRDQTIYIADFGNHRIVEWKPGALEGRVMAGGNGHGKGEHQLNGPVAVILDQKSNDLIISDYGNRRIVRWSRQSVKKGRTIISNIGCCGLMMDKNERSLYVVDEEKHAVRRYLEGETGEGKVVAGGNGQGNGLHQLCKPRFVYVDDDQSVYVSDWGNHRVMKSKKDAKEGIVVAGEQGEGNSLRQLSFPSGLLVDTLGNIYACDTGNKRIVRWNDRLSEGKCIVGANEPSKNHTSGSLSEPACLSIDHNGNLYVTEGEMHRLQKFTMGDPE